MEREVLVRVTLFFRILPAPRKKNSRDDVCVTPTDQLSDSTKKCRCIHSLRSDCDGLAMAIRRAIITATP